MCSIWYASPEASTRPASRPGSGGSGTDLSTPNWYSPTTASVPAAAVCNMAVRRRPSRNGPLPRRSASETASAAALVPRPMPPLPGRMVEAGGPPGAPDLHAVLLVCAVVERAVVAGVLVTSQPHVPPQSPCPQAGGAPPVTALGRVQDVHRAGEFGMAPHQRGVPEHLIGLRVDLFGQQPGQGGTQPVQAMLGLLDAAEAR